MIELEDGLLPVIGKPENRYQGKFPADDTIFEKTRFRAEEVKSRMHETAYLNPTLPLYLKTEGANRQNISNITSRMESWDLSGN